MKKQKDLSAWWLIVIFLAALAFVNLIADAISI